MMDEVGVTELRQALAEVCGLTPWTSGPGLTRYRNDKHIMVCMLEDWRPDQDIAQAIMCVKATGLYWGIGRKGDDGMFAWIIKDSFFVEVLDPSEAKALARAVYAWAKEKKHG